MGTGRREKGRKDLRTRLRNRRMKNRTPSILVQTPSILVIFGKLMMMVCVGLSVNGLMFSPICTPFPFPRNVYVRTYLCLSVRVYSVYACMHGCKSGTCVLACFCARAHWRVNARARLCVRALVYECVGSVCVLTRARACICTYVRRTNGRNTCPLQCGNAVSLIRRSILRLCECACVLCARTRACVHIL